MLKETLLEFLDCMLTVPGTGYLSRSIKDRKWGTSVLWTCIFILNIILCSYMISYLRVKYYESQFIITVENHYPIDQVDFPAISICNKNIIHKDQMRAVDRILLSNNQSRDRIDSFYNDLSYLQRPTHPSKIHDNYTDILKILKLSHFNRVDEIMFEGRQSCESMLKFCMVKNKKTPCSEIFQMVKTMYGFCCAFNYAFTNHATEMSDEPSQKTREVINSRKILKIPDTGILVGLFVIFKIKTSDISNTSLGAKILVSESSDYPEESLHRRNIEQGEDMTLSLSASISSVTAAIRRMQPEQRQCWLKSDKKLFLNSAYVYHTCITSCRIVQIILKCNCLPHYYVLPKNLPFRYCVFEDTECLHNFHMTDIDDRTECDCLPECKNMRFHVNNIKRETRIKSDMHRNREINMTFENYSMDELNSLSTIQVYFKSNTGVIYTQDVLMQWYDLLAAYGGTVNFCLGGSIVTLFEIFFFLLALSCRKLTR